MPVHIRRLKLAAFVVLIFIMLTPADARAQSSPATRDAARAEMEMRQKQWDVERLKRESPVREPDTRPDFGEVAEEFEQLQLVNYSLAGVADPRVPLDYVRVRKESAEVRKRAARLKTYLVLPEIDGKPDKAAEIRTPEALRAAVGKLDALVYSFAWNPVFQRPDVVDLELSTKASRDLAGIISLSEQIRKSAEELGKPVRSIAKK